MTALLRFWVDAEYGAICADHLGKRRSQRIARILLEFEEAGDAMRYRDTDGRIAWKATPQMLRKLADAEQEAKDDLADCP
jgi:hypothetical protein